MKPVLLAVLLALAAAGANAASNVLSWTDNSTNETSFVINRKIEACAGTSAFTQLSTVGANVVTYTDSAVVEGSTYCYEVAGANSAGTSAWSNTAERTVPFTVPVAPSGLKAVGGP